MKPLLLHNWKAKLVSFLLALVLWVAVKETLARGFIDQLMTGTITSSNP